MDSHLLLDQRPLVILPELAKDVGLNEAVVLQQVHYWVGINAEAGRNFREGYYWTFNSYRQWQVQFPFWSLATVRRTMASLEASGHLITGAFNKMAGDRSKWYRIDYGRLGVSIPSAQSEHPSAQPEQPCVQNEPTNTREYLQKPPPKTTPKKHYADNVLMTEEQYATLVGQFGESSVKERVERLSLYKHTSGKKYKSDYHAVKTWARRDNERGTRTDRRRAPETATADRLRESVGKPIG